MRDTLKTCSDDSMKEEMMKQTWLKLNVPRSVDKSFKCVGPYRNELITGSVLMKTQIVGPRISDLRMTTLWVFEMEKNTGIEIGLLVFLDV